MGKTKPMSYNGMVKSSSLLVMTMITGLISLMHSWLRSMLHGADIAKISKMHMMRLVNNFSTVLQDISLLNLTVTNTKKSTKDLMLLGTHILFSTRKERLNLTMVRERLRRWLNLLKSMDLIQYRDLTVVSSLNKKEEKDN